MNDLYDDIELYKCTVYPDGHKYTYNAEKSVKESSVYTCICGSLIDENEDANAGC